MNDTLEIKPAPLPYERETSAIVYWILTQPSWQKAFPDHEPADVVRAVVTHLRAKTIRIMQDNVGNILGVMMFKPDEEMHEIDLKHLLGRSPMIVPAALEAWRQEYPCWGVRMMRNRKPRSYRFDQFFKEKGEK